MCEYLKKLTVVIAILGIQFCPAQKTGQDRRPNVIVIVVDDMNMWSMLKNYAPLQTPALDRLKSQALYFPHASCAAPVCIPSRASFFSGRAPYETGAYVNYRGTWDNNSLSTTEVIPETFKENGYITWGMGKIFHAPINAKRQDKMFDNKVEHGGFGPFAKKEYHYAKSRWFSIKPWTGPDSDFPDVRNANAAISFLQQDHDRPFFMYYGLYRPHTPYTAPKRFYDLYENAEITMAPGYLPGDLDDVPLQGRQLVDSLLQYHKEGRSKEEVLLEMIRGYCANYSFADWNIGRVMEALDKSPYADNTIVVFYSDNGFHNGTKNHWVKSTLWEQADGVPFLVRLPGRTPAECLQTVSLLDVYPTLVDYCGLEPPAHEFSGKSMVPVFNDPEADWNRPGFTSYGENYSSVRDKRYRYIRYPDGSEELYDHKHDPYEHKNLASDPSYKDLISELSRSIPGVFATSLGGKKEKTAKSVRND
ncbi:sulfatase [Sinomicrobium soli]|uniref:sulfatase n=1 Tax=Sinomicrobium sp. N-1-3-6 TaxID=2219864 RepID=UPI000DCEF8A1|nr:sulfatase [Sinomicrobium sp. N-1-3-6]RAV30259.1 iduronate-2-sulfatase [Sinomicrobium sp. N-1-3-6]